MPPCHMGSADRHQTFSPTFRRAKSSNRQNRALPYLKAQDGTTLNVVFEPQLSLRRSNQEPPRPTKSVLHAACRLSEEKKKRRENQGLVLSNGQDSQNI